MFDETGDRLTPSHTKTGKGRRLRYYVSHRLIRSSGPKDPGGWRLPGPELEVVIAYLVRKHLGVAAVQANIVSAATTEEIAGIAQRLAEMTAVRSQTGDATTTILLGMIDRVQIAPGKLALALSAKAISDNLCIAQDRISEEHLNIESDFRTRKRGVETKLILADSAEVRDDTLFKNIALAHRYFTMIRSGQTYEQIAQADGASKRRIQ